MHFFSKPIHCFLRCLRNVTKTSYCFFSSRQNITIFCSVSQWKILSYLKSVSLSFLKLISTYRWTFYKPHFKFPSIPQIQSKLLKEIWLFKVHHPSHTRRGDVYPSTHCSGTNCTATNHCHQLRAFILPWRITFFFPYLWPILPRNSLAMQQQRKDADYLLDRSLPPTANSASTVFSALRVHTEGAVCSSCSWKADG